MALTGKSCPYQRSSSSLEFERCIGDAGEFLQRARPRWTCLSFCNHSERLFGLPEVEAPDQAKRIDERGDGPVSSRPSSATTTTRVVVSADEGRRCRPSHENPFLSSRALVDKQTFRILAQRRRPAVLLTVFLQARRASSRPTPSTIATSAALKIGQTRRST